MLENFFKIKISTFIQADIIHSHFQKYYIKMFEIFDEFHARKIELFN